MMLLDDAPDFCVRGLGTLAQLSIHDRVGQALLRHAVDNLLAYHRLRLLSWLFSGGKRLLLGRVLLHFRCILLPTLVHQGTGFA